MWISLTWMPVRRRRRMTTGPWHPCPLGLVASYTSVEVQVLLNGGKCVFKLSYNVYC
jgi:hypothetical protein